MAREYIDQLRCFSDAFPLRQRRQTGRESHVPPQNVGFRESTIL
jgi:hypothetical protein